MKKLIITLLSLALTISLLDTTAFGADIHANNSVSQSPYIYEDENFLVTVEPTNLNISPENTISPHAEDWFGGSDSKTITVWYRPEMKKVIVFVGTVYYNYSPKLMQSEIYKAEKRYGGVAYAGISKITCSGNKATYTLKYKPVGAESYIYSEVIFSVNSSGVVSTSFNDEWN